MSYGRKALFFDEFLRPRTSCGLGDFLQSFFIAPCQNFWTAYVYIVDPKQSDLLGDKASQIKASQQLKAAGYQVVGFNADDLVNASRVYEALNDPCIRALWLNGHGITKGVTTAYGWFWWTQNYAQPIVEAAPNTGQTEATSFEPSGFTDLTKFYSRSINVVDFQACYQKSSVIAAAGTPYGGKSPLGAWTSMFPCANIAGWSRAVTPMEISWFQGNRMYAKLNQSSGLPTTTVSQDPALDLRLDMVQPTFPSVDGGYSCASADPNGGSVGNSCLLQGTMTERQFGNESFNFFVANDTYPSERTLLAGIVTQNGCVSSVSNSTIVSNFNVTMTNSAFGSTLVNTDSFPSLVASCPSAYSSVPICIDTQSPSPSVLLAGFRQLLFGTPMLANFTYSPTVSHPGQPITFTSYATGRNDTLPYTFQWTFGDGGGATCLTNVVEPYGYATPVGCTVTHMFVSASTYPVSLTVTDAQGNTVPPLYCNCNDNLTVSGFSGGGGGGSRPLEL